MVILKRFSFCFADLFPAMILLGDVGTWCKDKCVLGVYYSSDYLEISFSISLTHTHTRTQMPISNEMCFSIVTLFHSCSLSS